MTDAMSTDLVVTTPLELEIRRLLAEHRERTKLQAAAEVARADAAADAARRNSWRWLICSCALMVALSVVVAAGSYFGHQRIKAAENTIDDLTANQLALDVLVDAHERTLNKRGGPL